MTFLNGEISEWSLFTWRIFTKNLIIFAINYLNSIDLFSVLTFIRAFTLFRVWWIFSENTISIPNNYYPSHHRVSFKRSSIIKPISIWLYIHSSKSLKKNNERVNPSLPNSAYLRFMIKSTILKKKKNDTNNVLTISLPFNVHKTGVIKTRAWI